MKSSLPAECLNFKKKLFELLTDIVDALPDESSDLQNRINEIMTECPALKDSESESS